jgi:hypothetical protein
MMVLCSDVDGGGCDVLPEDLISGVMAIHNGLLEKPSKSKSSQKSELPTSEPLTLVLRNLIA